MSTAHSLRKRIIPASLDIALRNAAKRYPIYLNSPARQRAISRVRKPANSTVLPPTAPG